MILQLKFIMGAKIVRSDNYYCDEEFNRDLPPQHVKSVKWVRIKNLHKKPKYFVNDLCVCDLVQGDIGNCYFVSAIHSLILYYNTNRKLLYKFLKQIKPWQQFDDSTYTGKFSVSLWNSFGLQEVQVDDYIPVNIYTNKPCYTSNRHNEYWVSILEKAVAKFTNSSYKEYDLGGSTANIFRLFVPTGIRSLLLSPSVEELTKYLAARENLTTAALFKETAAAKRSGAWRETIDSDSNIALEHAYCIHVLDKETVLVINPWNQVEWAESVESVNERSVSQNVCRMCNVEHREDGRWVMRVEDLVKIFDAFFVYSFDSQFSHLPVRNGSVSLPLLNLSKPIIVNIIILDDDETVINVHVNDVNNNRISQYESLTTCKINTLYISANGAVLNVSIGLSINKNYQVFTV